MNIKADSPLQTRAGQDENNAVLIIDPIWVVRNGLRHLFLQEAKFQTVFEAGDVAEAVRLIEKFDNIKLIIMELMRPDDSLVDGFGAIHTAAAGIPVVVMSDICNRNDILEAIELGASAFVPKDATAHEILLALRDVSRGQIYISKPLLVQTRQRAPSNRVPDVSQRDDAIASLTQRQREVLGQLALGHSNRTIGEHLRVSEHTVKLHVAAILRTLKVDNRTQAALYLAQPGHSRHSAE